MDYEILLYLPFLRLIPVSLSGCRSGPSGDISPIPSRFGVKFARKRDLSAATLFGLISESTGTANAVPVLDPKFVRWIITSGLGQRSSYVALQRSGTYTRL